MDLLNEFVPKTHHDVCSWSKLLLHLAWAAYLDRVSEAADEEFGSPGLWRGAFGSWRCSADGIESRDTILGQFPRIVAMGN